MILWSFITVIFFLGGWLPLFIVPIVMGYIFFSVKSMMILSLFCALRAALPRYRWDQLMTLAWRAFLPMVLLGCFFVYTLYISSIHLNEALAFIPIFFMKYKKYSSIATIKNFRWFIIFFTFCSIVAKIFYGLFATSELEAAAHEGLLALLPRGFIKKINETYYLADNLPDQPDYVVDTIYRFTHIFHQLEMSINVSFMLLFYCLYLFVRKKTPITAIKLAIPLILFLTIMSLTFPFFGLVFMVLMSFFLIVLMYAFRDLDPNTNKRAYIIQAHILGLTAATGFLDFIANLYICFFCVTRIRLFFHYTILYYIAIMYPTFCALYWCRTTFSRDILYYDLSTFISVFACISVIYFIFLCTIALKLIPASNLYPMYLSDTVRYILHESDDSNGLTFLPTTKLLSSFQVNSDYSDYYHKNYSSIATSIKNFRRFIIFFTFCSIVATISCSVFAISELEAVFEAAKEAGISFTEINHDLEASVFITLMKLMNKNMGKKKDFYKYYKFSFELFSFKYFMENYGAVVSFVIALILFIDFGVILYLQWDYDHRYIMFMNNWEKFSIEVLGIYYVHCLQWVRYLLLLGAFSMLLDLLSYAIYTFINRNPNSEFSQGFFTFLLKGHRQFIINKYSFTSYQSFLYEYEKINDFAKLSSLTKFLFVIGLVFVVLYLYLDSSII